jgi:hypothetical protein
MIRRTLAGLLLGLVTLAEPSLATADTASNPKKTPLKAAPRVPESAPPTKLSRLQKYRSLNTYHPHKGRGHSKQTKPGTP